MQADNNGQPISIAARRRTTSSDAQPMSAERKAAYRHLALVVLGMDVQTLTNQLRARRLQREAPLRMVSCGERAA